jgi:hypothetical protein
MFRLIFLLAALPVLLGAAAREARAEGTDPRRFAVLVGVNNYWRSPSRTLEGPVTDVDRLADALTAHGRFPAAQVRRLSSRFQALKDQPARDNIIDVFGDTLKKVPDGGLLLFFFAGHGLYSQGESYLLGADFDGDGASPSELFKRALPVDLLNREIAAAGRNVDVVFIIDACRDDKTARISDDNQSFYGDFSRGLSKQAALFSTTAGQRSWESPTDRMGYFTRELVAVLNAPDGYANADGLVTFASVVNAVKGRMVRALASERPGVTQQPSEKMANGGGDVVLGFSSRAGRQQLPIPTLPPDRALLRLTGEVHIVADPRLRVTIDANQVLGPQEIKSVVELAPGSHQLLVELPGYKPKRLSLEMAVNQVEQRRLELEVDRPWWGALSPARRVTLLALGGGSLVALATGTGFAISAHGQQGEHQRAVDEARIEARPLREIQSTGEQRERIARWLLVAGAASLTAAVAVALTGGPSPELAMDAQVSREALAVGYRTRF